MHSQVYTQIQKLITEGGKDDPKAISYIRTKLMLKGINPDNWKPDSIDSPKALLIVNNFYHKLIERSKNNENN